MGRLAPGRPSWQFWSNTFYIIYITYIWYILGKADHIHIWYNLVKPNQIDYISYTSYIYNILGKASHSSQYTSRSIHVRGLHHLLGACLLPLLPKKIWWPALLYRLTQKNALSEHDAAFLHQALRAREQAASGRVRLGLHGGGTLHHALKVRFFGTPCSCTNEGFHDYLQNSQQQQQQQQQQI